MNSTWAVAAVATDYLHQAADTIRGANSSEAALRSAIGRAYYAVYLTARDSLFGPDGQHLTGALQKKFRKKYNAQLGRFPGSHEIVILAIGEAKPSNIIKPMPLMHQVEQLKQARVHADYHFTQLHLSGVPARDWRKYAEDTVQLASQVLPVVRSLPHC